MKTTDEHSSELKEAHRPCTTCGSSDAECLYDDGHTYCFSCGVNIPGDGEAAVVEKEDEAAPPEPTKGEFVRMSAKDLGKRKLKKATLEKLGYGVGKFSNKAVQVAAYTDSQGTLTGQKIRFANKEFLWLADKTKEITLFGQHAWREGGETVIVTEGEIDALSLAQVLSLKTPVVSIRRGSKGARKDLEENFEWLDSFKNIVLCFDMDDPGREAMFECADLFSPNKCFIAQLPLKDASDMLVEGREKELIDSVMTAKPYRPDGLVSGEVVWNEIIKEDNVPHLEYPWSGLQESTRGIRGGEIVTWCAGSGIGKSAVCKEIAVWIRSHGEKIGYIALEESVKRTAIGLIGIVMDKPLWLYLEEEMPEEKDLRSAFDEVIGGDGVTFYDHFGSTEGETLLAKIRYMAKACGIKYIFLDHLSIVVSGMTEGDERRRIDNLMTSLRSLVAETNCSLHVVSHLKRPEGKGHEDGARTSLAQLRGSAGIAQLSDIVIGLERDQQDPETREVTTIRVLKNRFTGVCGLAGALRYSALTGRLKEVDSFDEMSGRGDGNPMDSSDDKGAGDEF